MKAAARFSSNGQPQATTAPAAATFIPDLCQRQSVLLMLILTQLFALIMALGVSRHALLDWSSLGLLSIYSHVIALSCGAIICASRSRLAALSHRSSGLACLLLIVGTTLIISHLCAYWLGGHLIGDPVLFVWRSVLIGIVLGALLLRYFYLQYQWREQKQAELRSRLEALQARIRPHFLFNSMNTIASLISIDPHKAEDAVLDLSTLFRATLQTRDMLISLDEELELCRRYLNIEALRLGDRLHLDWQLSGDLGQVMIPPLTLQPLLENAIYHGIQPLTEGGTIRIESDRRDHTVYVLISNPYDALAQQQRGHHGGNQIALDNIRHRFLALFGDTAVLKTSQQDGQFTVTLRFPLHNDEAASALLKSTAASA